MNVFHKDSIKITTDETIATSPNMAPTQNHFRCHLGQHLEHLAKNLFRLVVKIFTCPKATVIPNMAKNRSYLVLRFDRFMKKFRLNSSPQNSERNAATDKNSEAMTGN